MLLIVQNIITKKPLVIPAYTHIMKHNTLDTCTQSLQVSIVTRNFSLVGRLQPDTSTNQARHH